VPSAPAAHQHKLPAHALPLAPTQVWDIARERLSHVCNHHAKGVHGFVYSRAYSMFASCGLERDVMIWQVRVTAGCAGEGWPPRVIA
jgi:hypothetical protein